MYLRTTESALQSDESSNQNQVRFLAIEYFLVLLIKTQQVQAVKRSKAMANGQTYIRYKDKQSIRLTNNKRQKYQQTEKFENVCQIKQQHSFNIKRH